MPVACRLVSRTSGEGREYAVVDTDSGAVEFRHGSDTAACRRQATAINANVEGSTERRNRRGAETMTDTPAALRVTKQTPLEYGEHLRALESDGNAAALGAELDAVDSWRARYSRAREGGVPMGMVGRGWGAVDFFRAREIAARALEQIDLPRMDRGRTHDDYVPRTREGGIHGHRLNMAGRAELGGAHRHSFLYKGVMYMTEKDGAHEHDAAEGELVASESEHTHKAFVPAGEGGAMVEVEFAGSTDHEHEKLVAVTVHDGVHEHTADVEGEAVKTLTPEEFRAMFGEVAAVMIGGNGPDGMVATEGLELRDWWADGKGNAEAREALARYALDEAVTMSPMDCPLSVDSDAGGYYAIVGADYATIGDVCDVDLERALEAAIAKVDREHPVVALAGPPAGEGLEGGRVMRPLLYKFELTESGRARESIICTAVEGFTDPWGGRVIEAADDLVWELVVLEFGLSDNGNFWPNTIGDELVRALEGVPIEEVQYDPLMRDHLPAGVLRRFPGGATGNFVGLVDGLRVDSSTGGKAPAGRALEAIAAEMKIDAAAVVAASRGAIVGMARFDKSQRGRNVDAQLRTAEAAGHLDHFLGVSIDVSHAPFTPLRVPGLRRPIRVRSAVDATDRRVVTLATRPSAGGTFVASVAA